MTSKVSAYVVSDNVAVVGVRATWSAAGGGTAEMTPDGSGWSFIYDPPSGYNTSVTFNLVARDAAGNQSPVRQTSVMVYVTCVG
jgi:hypothetical protein